MAKLLRALTFKCSIALFTEGAMVMFLWPISDRVKLLTFRYFLKTYLENYILKSGKNNLSLITFSVSILKYLFGISVRSIPLLDLAGKVDKM